MNEGKQISQLEKAENIPDGSMFIAEMGDGSGTKTVREEILAQKVEKRLKLGDMEQLDTKAKDSFVKALNEVNEKALGANGGAGGKGILESIEESEANTEEGYLVDALVVKELINKLGGCHFEPKEDGVYITYTLPGGADSVTKKLQSEFEFEVLTGQYTATYQQTHTVSVERRPRLILLDCVKGGYNDLGAAFWSEIEGVPSGHNLTQFIRTVDEDKVVFKGFSDIGDTFKYFILC